MGRSAMRSGSSSRVYLPDAALKRLSRLGVAEPSTTQAFGGLGAHDGDVAAVIARGFLLLVAGVVFFVDHDEAEIAHGREDAGTRADHDAARRPARIRRH